MEPRLIKESLEDYTRVMRGQRRRGPSGAFVEPVPVHGGLEDHAGVGPSLHQCGEVMRRVMLDAAFAKVAACGINRVPDAVLFVVVDADEGGGFGDDGETGSVGNGVRVQLLDKSIPCPENGAWHAAFAFNPPGLITTSWHVAIDGKTFFMMTMTGASFSTR